ncbi:hypothetical protein CAEBREN_15138 [Caenorhabditis brenneri]|uniref:Uncharacterized protein n=1 Tax=Caenorhabditis brenneri TaxID=135651 RepID=G0MVP8_CAEBE|nr:hypothetical protein CAEBREN_15138 [Caenorhabditis brenneri]
MRPSSASTPLSSSALNYLESLERNAKALRGNNNTFSNKKDESSTIATSKQISTTTPLKRRESISDIINQARRRSSLSRTNSEDLDFLNESLKSSILDESDSSSSESEESHEEKRILPLGTPGQQVGRKSLKDIRELRNSIDQSLIKTPELKMLRTKVGGEETKKLRHFESIREEEVQEETPKTVFPTKSPFKKAIQSGSDSSDGESIVFDEVFEEVLPSPPRKPAAVRAQAVTDVQKSQSTKAAKKKEKTPTPTSSSSESSSSSSSASSSSESSSSTSESESSSKSHSSTSSTKTSTSKTTSKPAYESDFESSSSTSSSSSSTIVSKASSVKPVKPAKSRKSKEEAKKVLLLPYEDFIPKKSSSSESAKSTVRETHRTLEESLKLDKMKLEDREQEKFHENSRKSERKSSVKATSPKEKPRAHRSSSSSSSSAVGETEREIEYERRRFVKLRSQRRRRRISEEPHTCQQNIHNMVESVIDTHVQMLDEFNRMEYAAVCEWTDVLRRFDRHDGPTSQRLREIVERRLNRKY